MGSLIRRALLLAAAATIAGACGSSNSSDLVGPAHGSGGGSQAGSGGTGAGGSDAGVDGAPDSSAGGAAGSAGSNATGGVSGAGGGNGGSGATAGSSGAGGSAGNGGSAGSGGGGGTPGSINCGLSPCTTNFNVCCVCTGCFPKLTVCYPKITGCTTGKPLYCDDAADCTTGHVCCAHFDPKTYAFLGASCDTSCPDKDNATLCVTDSECKAGTHCLALASVPGFKACQ